MQEDGTFVQHKDKDGNLVDAECGSSNKLRFLGKEGYESLRESKTNQTPIKIAVAMNDKGSFFYLVNDATVDQLFATPLEREDTRIDISDLF